jgi:hypothetical protein
MLFLISSPVVATISLNAQEEPRSAKLVFAQVYGTAVFVKSNSVPPSDAANVVLAFESQGHRNFALAQNTGDFIVLLEPGKYCLSAYTRNGRPLQLDAKQLKCIDVQPGRDSRLDVLLDSSEK